jgi:hypothetical protein
MEKYMPLSLRVITPTSRDRKKLKNPPIMITKGRGRLCPSTADVYIPTPKKAAEASEIYPVGPEKRTQLTVIMIYISMLHSSIIL